MIHKIYFGIVLIITVISLIYYYLQEEDHMKELEKINKMEMENRKELEQIAYFRSKSVPCSAGNFTDPRSCYIDSDYTCTWNSLAKRCDKK